MDKTSSNSNVQSNCKNESQEIDILMHCNNENDNHETSVETVTLKELASDNEICLSNSQEKLPSIPDGGWGWVLVIVAFIMYTCTDGLAYVYGYLHIEFIKFFNTNWENALLIGNLFLSTPLLTAPITGALVNQYGCRFMTMTAGVISTIGFLLASASNSIEMLCVTMGFISGLANGTFLVTAVVSVVFWFENRRNLAIALTCSGIGFGALIYSPMTQYFLDVYEWRDTLVLLAGTLLNMCVCGALMRNPDWLEIKIKRRRIFNKFRNLKKSKLFSKGGLESLLRSGESPENILDILASNVADKEDLQLSSGINTDQFINKSNSLINLPRCNNYNEKISAEVVENAQLVNVVIESEISKVQTSQQNLYSHRNEYNNASKSPLELDAENSNNFEMQQMNSKKVIILDESKVQYINTDDGKYKTEQIIDVAETSDSKYVKKPLEKKIISLKTCQAISTNRLLKRPVTTSSLPNINYKSLESKSSDKNKWFYRYWDYIITVFDFRMVVEFHFLMLNLSHIILSAWFIVPYYFLQSYMNSLEIDGAVLLINVVQFSINFGVILVGWIGDRPWVNVTKSYAICLILCGLSIASYPLFITNHYLLIIISATFGLIFSSSFPFVPSILLELLPIDNFAVAFGCTLFSQGVGHLIGPPAAEILNNLNPDLVFYIGGLFLVISGISVGVISYTKNIKLFGEAPLLKDAYEARVM